MSLRKGDRRSTPETGRPKAEKRKVEKPKERKSKANSEIDLKSIISFLKFTVCMTAGIAVLAALGLFVVRDRPEAAVVYEMVLAVNALVLAGGFFGIRYLNRKDEELTKKKEEKS